MGQLSNVMIRILVPTDFSTASRTGLRFAIQWSRQQEVKITFVHVLHIPHPTAWSDRQFHAFAAAEKIRCREKLDKFVSETFRKLDMADVSHSRLILEGASPDIAICDYCRQHPEIDFICMGTRGAGKLKKIWGTHTGNLITHSPVPVIAVPGNYRIRPVTRLLYATDLSSYKEELKKVAAIATPLKATVNVLHLTQPGEVKLDRELIEEVFSRDFRYDLKFNFKTEDPGRTQVGNLQHEIATLRPSLVIMFTHQDRNLFQRIFFPSRTESLAFDLKTPLLVFGKASRPS
ncbi:MAG: universal stress protein [Bacteroidota bacterium]